MIIPPRSNKRKENLDEVSGRQKHHMLWTISKVKKLIDDVSQYGVERWNRIKKLVFSSSVDLKDKWRNLLKAHRFKNRGNSVISLFLWANHWFDKTILLWLIIRQSHISPLMWRDNEAIK